MTEPALYAIYAHPTDFPDHFVCRRWSYRTGEVLDPGEPFALSASLEQMRKHIPPGLSRVDRCEEDPPAVVEVWI